MSINKPGGMTRDVATPCANCKPCVFECRNGKWHFDGQTHDCYGCNGSGVDQKCEEHKEKHDDE